MGAVDHVTSQPVKGRKRGGGVRFGEMERDGLVSHGALYLLYDRLFNCSDQSTVRSIIFIYNTFFFFSIVSIEIVESFPLFYLLTRINSIL